MSPKATKSVIVSGPAALCDVMRALLTAEIKFKSSASVHVFRDVVK